jgi:hypothetical protein
LSPLKYFQYPNDPVPYPELYEKDRQWNPAMVKLTMAIENVSTITRTYPPLIKKPLSSWRRQEKTCKKRIGKKICQRMTLLHVTHPGTEPQRHCIVFLNAYLWKPLPLHETRLFEAGARGGTV